MNFRRAALFLICASWLLTSLSAASADDALSCPKCQRNYPREPRYCPADGAALKKIKAPQRACPRCGLVFARGQKFCPNDGFKLVLHKALARHCKKCQRSFSGGEMFCPFDGQNLIPKAKPKLEPSAPKRQASKVVKVPLAARDKGAAASKVTLTRQLIKKFAASSKNTAVIPFQMAKGGEVDITVEFAGDAKVLVLLYAPGFVKPIAKRDGLSPVKLKASVDEATVSLKKKFELWIVLRDGADSFGKVTFQLPTNGFVKDSNKVHKAKLVSKKTKSLQITEAIPSPPSKKSKAAVAKNILKMDFKLDSKGNYNGDFEVDKDGRLDIKVDFGKGKELVVILRNRLKMTPLVDKRGQSPIQLFYQVTGGQRKFRLWIINFADKDKSGRGKIVVTKP
jgi:RNA polymerase subunit RPABC4/transcription elongation factor Spt4